MTDKEVVDIVRVTFRNNCVISLYDQKGVVATYVSDERGTFCFKSSLATNWMVSTYCDDEIYNLLEFNRCQFTIDKPSAKENNYFLYFKGTLLATVESQDPNFIEFNLTPKKSPAPASSSTLFATMENRLIRELDSKEALTGEFWTLFAHYREMKKTN